MSTDVLFDSVTGRLTLSRALAGALAAIGDRDGLDRLEGPWREQLTEAGLLDGDGDPSEELLPVLDALNERIADLHLSIRFRGREILAGGAASVAWGVLLMPSSQQADAVEPIVFATPALAARVADFVRLGPRPLTDPDAALAVWRDRLDDVVASGEVLDADAAGVALGLDEVPAAARRTLAAIAGDAVLHWTLAVVARGTDLARTCEVIDALDDGLWLVDDHPSEGLVALLNARSTEVWMQLNSLLPSDEEISGAP